MIIPSFDFDTWKRQRREDRRQRLNATYPHCDTDLLEELEHAAGDTLSESILIGCPTCEAEIEFKVSWTIEPHSAEITSTAPVEVKA